MIEPFSTGFQSKNTRADQSPVDGNFRFSQCSLVPGQAHRAALILWHKQLQCNALAASFYQTFDRIVSDLLIVDIDKGMFGLEAGSAEYD